MHDVFMYVLSLSAPPSQGSSCLHLPTMSLLAPTRSISRALTFTVAHVQDQDHRPPMAAKPVVPPSRHQ